MDNYVNIYRGTHQNVGPRLLVGTGVGWRSYGEGEAGLLIADGLLD